MVEDPAVPLVILLAFFLLGCKHMLAAACRNLNAVLDACCQQGRAFLLQLLLLGLHISLPLLGHLVAITDGFLGQRRAPGGVILRDSSFALSACVSASSGRVCG